MRTRFVLLSAGLVLVSAVPTMAQFRRGLLAESTEITLSPISPPALLLPPGAVEVQVRNTSTASARVVDRIRDLFGQQLTDNDSRLTVASQGDVIIVATLTEWRESRRNSTKYVSEQRQIGTRQTRDKNGNIKHEPVYEYGHNEPSVVIEGVAGIRVEARRRAGGPPLADEIVRHTIHQEHLVREGPPTRDVIEDQLLDNAVRKAAGRVSPGREPVHVLLARSDDVDRLNGLAQNRRWQEWLEALTATKPNRDRKKDSYRLHNLAVANEAIAYEATALEEQSARLREAGRLIIQAGQQNPDEKYIAESQARIHTGTTNYAQLAELYAQAKEIPLSAPTSQRAVPPASAARSTASPSAPAPGAPTTAAMTNKDVVDLRVAGLDDDNLIAAIKDAKAVNFDLSPAGLKTLLGAKVSNRVITAMRARTQ
jgi:hypothetical protein